jgi:hypothetical protein
MLPPKKVSGFIRPLHFEFVNFEGNQLTAISSANLTVRLAPADLGCYVLHKNRTEAGIAKERLRSYWES